jgi:hypothetical protein
MSSLARITESFGSNKWWYQRQNSSQDHRANSPSVDWEEDKKEENDQTLSIHESVLDKIINDTNNAYQIQATSDDVFMSCGPPVADIETFLRSATLVIECVPDTSKSNDKQKGLLVCARHTSFIDLMGLTLLFCVFLSTTHSNTEKCCFTHVEPDPPVRAPCLLLSLSSSIPQLHRHGPNS